VIEFGENKKRKLQIMSPSTVNMETTYHNILAGTVLHTLEDEEDGACNCTVAVDIVAVVGRTVAVHVDASWGAAVAAVVVVVVVVSATPIAARAVSLRPPFFPFLLPSMQPSQSCTFLVMLFLRRQTASFLHP
jgi:hypothetical protein